MPSSTWSRSAILSVAALVLSLGDGGAAQVAPACETLPRPPARPAAMGISAAAERPIVSGGPEAGRSCTILYAADRRVALAGNNEDWTGMFAKIQFLPATPGKFGRVYFGFDELLVPQGGMNERGLFFDMASAEGVAVPCDSSKAMIAGGANGVMYKAMEECSTVDEVLEYFERYDHSGYWNGQFIVGDRFGNSAIIEPLTVIRKTGRYQVVTNFLQSKTAAETSQDPRFRIATKLLDESKEFSVELMRRVLSATHYEECSGSETVTLYSYICDLKRGDIYIYNFHDFTQVAQINLRKELAKGESLRTIASLFPYETYAERLWKAWRVIALLCERATEKGMEGPEGALALYHELCSGEEESTRYAVHETQLLAAAYRLLEKGQTELAIGMFEFNVSEHPESAQGYECLGGAYAVVGKKESAIECYEKSVALDPTNSNARQRLEDLRR